MLLDDRDLNAATYHRVSHEDQEYSSEDLEAFELVSMRGWTLVERYTDDVGQGPRLALERLMADARRGRFEVLVVYRAELLHRSRRELDAAIAELADLDVDLVTVLPLPPVPSETRGRPPAEFDVERARAMRRRGNSYRAIARELGVGHATVHRALSRKEGSVLRPSALMSRSPRFLAATR